MNSVLGILLVLVVIIMAIMGPFLARNRVVLGQEARGEARRFAAKFPPRRVHEDSVDDSADGWDDRQLTAKFLGRNAPKIYFKSSLQALDDVPSGKRKELVDAFDELLEKSGSFVVRSRKDGFPVSVTVIEEEETSSMRLVDSEDILAMIKERFDVDASTKFFVEEYVDASAVVQVFAARGRFFAGRVTVKHMFGTRSGGIVFRSGTSVSFPWVLHWKTPRGWGRTVSRIDEILAKFPVGINDSLVVAFRGDTGQLVVIGRKTGGVSSAPSTVRTQIEALDDE